MFQCNVKSPSLFISQAKNGYNKKGGDCNLNEKADKSSKTLKLSLESNCDRSRWWTEQQTAT